MTLKEMLDAVLLESGMDTETVYATSPRDEVLRLMNLANRSARTLSSGWKWQKLRRVYTFSLTDATTYDLPSDFRELVADSTYTNNIIEQVDMRPTPSEWRYLQTNGTGVGPTYKMRIIGGSIEVFEPQSGETVSFEYHSDHPVMATDGTTTKARFTADTDTFRLDDDMLIMEVIWRYKKLLGLQDWQVDYQEAQKYANLTRGQDAGAKTIYPGRETPQGVPYTQTWVNNA